MAENLEMPERESVRAPMQWADLPAAGFSGAPEADLPRAILRDGPFGYRKLNVEQQEADDASLLNWMERAIRTRKEWPELGWGDWRVLGTRSAKALAHVATWDGSSALAVHNFADAPVRISVRLPEDAREGRWRHTFGARGADVPEIIDGRLSCELPAYGYHWFGRRKLV